MILCRQIAAWSRALIVTCVCAATSAYADSAKIQLDGRSLTMDQIIAIAENQAKIDVAPAADQQVSDSFQLLVKAADQGIPIYGVNRGVGLNKDHTIYQGSITDPQARKLSEQFNVNNLRTTSAGFGEEASESVTRATLAIRLNTLLTGRAGASPELVKMYQEFLNYGITPVLPTGGSVGEADISILSHVGLSMIGEGEVTFQGKRMAASDALKLAGLKPLVPVARDSLAIMSSNAYAAATGVIALHKTENLANNAHRVVALSLEGVNGNVAPFLSATNDLRPYSWASRSSALLRKELRGSYLFDTSSTRALQDPLSFRTANHQLGALAENIDRAKRLLSIQVNTADDNPSVITGLKPKARMGSQELSYFVKDGESVVGAVMPTNNFDPTPWSQQLQAVKVSLSQVTMGSAQRTSRLGSPEVTHLSRFLTPDDASLGFSAIQKAYVDLMQRNESLASNAPSNAVSIAGQIEDISTGAPRIAQELMTMAGNGERIFGIELMHAAQAVDLRQRENPALKLGEGSQSLFKDYRAEVPFLSSDRFLTPDIEKSRRFMSNRVRAGPVYSEACARRYAALKEKIHE